MVQTCLHFTSQSAFATARKDVLPAENKSNIVYLFGCECGCRYVGRTSMRLSESIKQHVPESLLHSDSLLVISLNFRCASDCMCFEGDKIMSFTYDKALCCRVQRE